MNSTAEPQRWASGDRVRHATKPEWGEGVVTAVEPAMVEGKPTQRLTIRFERAGVKKLAAVVAALEPADGGAKLREADEHAAAKAALGQLDDSKIIEVLTQVPESARDPFRGLADRFRETLDLYRFSGDGASLLDWAAMQTGLKDPLSRFSRHDLERFFERFKRALDSHSREIGLELARKDPASASKIVAAAPEQAKAAMRRVAGRR
ncbi:MAG: DUF3553 domain-containing protein [Planctomycetota bacterium]